MANSKKINVMDERETFEMEGKTYFSYFVKGVVRSREVRAGVMPPDKGGYTVLDIVFGDAMACELVVTPFEMKDDSGKTIAGNTYSVRSVDETGEVYECKIKALPSVR